MEHHQTDRDLINEGIIMNEWCDKFPGLWAEKLFHEGRYKADFGIYNKSRKLRAIAEVKERSKLFDTVIMDLSKAIELFNYAEAGLDSLFIIRVPEGIFYYKFYTHQKLAVIRTARHHKSNKRLTDNGPVVELDRKHFTALSDVRDFAREKPA